MWNARERPIKRWLKVSSGVLGILIILPITPVIMLALGLLGVSGWGGPPDNLG